MGKGRRPCCDKAGVKKGPWSQAEDFKLISFIQKHGHSNWRALPKLAGLARCGKSCRLRWVNYLRPDLKRGNFSLQEEEAIIKLHGELGNKWSVIASKFPGRTDNEIKNVWNTHLKKRLKPKQSCEKSQQPSNILPTSISANEEVLDKSCSKDCSEQVDVTHQTSTIEDIIDVELSSSTSTSYTSQPPNLDHEMGDFNPVLDHLGDPSSITTENSRHKDDMSVTSDKYNEHNTLDELIEIPFEPNLDLWDLLDGESISTDLSDVHINEVVTNVFATTEDNKSSNENIDFTGESWWWLVYLENELGLDHHNESTSPQSSSSTSGCNHKVSFKGDDILVQTRENGLASSVENVG